MALKNRVIEIAYRLRDEFSRRIGSITGALERVEGNSKKPRGGLRKRIKGYQNPFLESAES